MKKQRRTILPSFPSLAHHHCWRQTTIQSSSSKGIFPSNLLLRTLSFLSLLVLVVGLSTTSIIHCTTTLRKHHHHSYHHKQQQQHSIGIDTNTYFATNMNTMIRESQQQHREEQSLSSTSSEQQPIENPSSSLSQPPLLLKERIRAMFIAHGSPTLCIEPSHGMNQLLSNQVAFQFKNKRPKAVVVFTAHWEAHPHVAISFHDSSTTYETIHDFYGFPREM